MAICKHPVKSCEPIERGWLRKIRPTAGIQECLVLLLNNGSYQLVPEGLAANASEVRACRLVYTLDTRPYGAERRFQAPSRSEGILFQVTLTITCRIVDAIRVSRESLDTETEVNRLALEEMVMQEAAPYEEQHARNAQIAIKQALNRSLRMLSPNAAFQFEIDNVVVESPVDIQRQEAALQKMQAALKQNVEITDFRLQEELDTARRASALTRMQAGPKSLIAEALAKEMITPLEAARLMEESSQNQITRNMQTFIDAYDQFVDNRSLISQGEARNLFKSAMVHMLGFDIFEATSGASGRAIEGASPTSGQSLPSEETPPFPSRSPDFDSD